MNSFLKWLAGNSLIRAQILGVGRHVASSIAGAVGLWLAAHGADQTTSADIVQALVVVITGLISYGFSIWDKGNVAVKTEATSQIAAVTGQAVAPEAAAELKGQIEQAKVDTAQAAKTTAAVADALQNAPKTDSQVDAILGAHEA